MATIERLVYPGSAVRADPVQKDGHVLAAQLTADEVEDLDLEVGDRVPTAPRGEHVFLGRDGI